MGQLALEFGQIGASGQGGTVYRTDDHLGSTRVETDAVGAVTGRCDYHPFGDQIDANATYSGRQAVAGYNPLAGASAMKFTGQVRDGETGLDYFGARYFSGAQGRFTSPDAPFADQHTGDPQSWNLYTYVRNNPLSSVDPDGRAVCSSIPCPPGTLPDYLKPGPPRDPRDPKNRPSAPSVWDAIDERNPELRPGYSPKRPDFAPLEPLPPSGDQIEVLQVIMPFVPGPLLLRPTQGPKPKLVGNPKHHQNSESPAPSNARELFERSIEDGRGRGTRWVKDGDGVIHRFSPVDQGRTHWNGSTAGPRPIKEDVIPPEIKRALK